MTTTKNTKAFQRTENNETRIVSIREGLDEANHAMMGGKKDVKTMSATSDRYDITYKDGRHIVLVKIDKPVEQTKPGEPGPKTRTGRQTRIITVKGKRYIVIAEPTPARVHTFGDGTTQDLPACVDYWSERNGETFGATRTTSENAKRGTIGRAIWDAITEQG